MTNYPVEIGHVPVTQTCPNCGESVTMIPYDIGSGQEMSCPSCEWCWGADGQDLKPLDHEKLIREAHIITAKSRAVAAARATGTDLIVEDYFQEVLDGADLWDEAHSYVRLAVNESLLGKIVQAICDPGTHLPRQYIIEAPGLKDYESVEHWGARAVMKVLRDAAANRQD